ncbi:MAG TPA: hypothetical protein VGH31_05800 [Acidimicrobiales bacterium]
MTSEERKSLSPRDRRLLMGYGPAVLIIAGFFAMALFIPSIAPEQNVSSASSSTNSGAASGTTATTLPSTTGTTLPTTTGTTVPGTPTSGVTSGTVAAGGTPAAGAGTGTCSGPQVAGDPYSPPCTTFTGSNGGATSRGVTANTITITYMNPTDGSQSVDQAIHAYTGSYNSVIFPETYAQEINTLQQLVAYFNAHFQFYGRKIVLQVFNGQQDNAGDNQSNVNADALNVADTIKAFGELDGTSEAYVEALTAQKVTSFDGGYFSQQFYQQESPYAWGYAPDCTELGQEVGTVAVKQLVGHNTQWAGTGVGDGKPRVFAVLEPDEQIYTQCASSITQALTAAGHPAAANIAYSANAADATATAQSITQQLKNDNITTILCLCDPVVQLLVSGDLNNAGYQPEWLNAAAAGEDTDDIAQIMNQSTWSHVAEITNEVTFAGKYGTTIGYAAAKSEDPSGALIVNEVDVLYQRLYQLAIGIQEAGPNLTPQSFAQGMWNYPGANGPFGPVSYNVAGTHYYTPTHQFEYQWYDPNQTSAYDGEEGTWITGSTWFTSSTIPASAPVFPNGPQ